MANFQECPTLMFSVASLSCEDKMVGLEKQAFP